MITMRQFTILQELKNNVYSSKSHLMEQCNIKDRTLRKEIMNLNAVADTPWIAMKKGSGYYVKDLEFLEKLLITKSELPIENREFHIIKYLVLEYKGIDIFDLADELFVSEATIEKDILLVKKKVSQYTNLSLERKKERIYLLGDEKARRSLLCELLVEESLKHDFNISVFNNCFVNINLIEIQDIVTSVFSKYAISFNDMVLLNIVLHIAIATERRADMETFRKGDNGQEKDIDTQITREILNQIETIYNIKYLDSEVQYLTMLIKGKRTFVHQGEDILYNTHFMDITTELVTYIYDSYGIDFRKDEELFQDLSIHIHGMHERILSQVTTHNVLLEKIKKNYPFVFELGVTLSQRYMQMTQLQMNESEIGFIVLHLVCAFERLEKAYRKLKIIIVCATGYSSSKIVEVKIHNAFHDKVQVIKTCSIQEFYKTDKSEYDIIITTVPIEIGNAEMLVCSPFFNQEDMNKLENTIKLFNKDHHLHKKISFFEQDLFFDHLDLVTKEEVITFLGNQLYDKEYVNETYIQSVLNREELSSTAYKEGIAIPHAMQMESSKTVVVVAILKKPIPWGKYKVQIVFLLSFKEKDNKELFGLYEKFATLSDHPSLIKEIIETNNFNNFMKLYNAI